MNTLTDKEKKKQLSNFKQHCGRITGAWSFGELKSWTDVYKRMGYSEEQLPGLPRLEKELVFPDLREYLAQQTKQLEDKLNGTTVEVPQAIQIQHKDEQSSVTGKSESETGKHNDRLVPETLSRSKGVDEETGLNNSSNYGLPEIKTWKAFHYWFQKKAIKEILDKILGFDIATCNSFEELKSKYELGGHKGKSGILLLSGTGTGKTFIVAAVARVLWDLMYHEERTWSHIPYLWITRTTVVEQAGRVCSRFYNLNPVNDVEVINIEQLRARAGQLWLKQEVKVVDGEEEVDWKWKPNINPCVIFFDESQAAKNSISTQHKIMCAYNNLQKNACLVSVSATPFTRVSEAKCFAVSTHKDITYINGKLSGFPEGTRLSNETWPTYAAMVCETCLPTEYNQAAIERLMKDLDEYIVRVRGVRPQFGAINSVKVINFETPEKRAFYEKAWLRFCEEKAKLDALRESGEGSAEACMFTILLKFAMAAEMCHAEHFADDMYKAVKHDGKAAVAAVKFKGTIIEIVKILNEKYGVSRDKISLVWGGGQTQLTKKQKAKNKVKELDEKFKAMGLSAEELLVDMGLDEVEDRQLQQLPAHLRLGQQSMEDRQKEIDAFQRGDSLFCLYTFKAGGVGLSLHHCDEITEFKCRRKESGYAVEDDIPKVPVRPRRNHVALTYNAIELVQGVGRCPRLTSLSTTEQYVYAYAGTVEMDIGAIVSQKLRCLSSVVAMKEDWQDVIMKGSNSGERAQKMKELIATTEGAKEEDGGLIEEGEDDEN